MKSSPRSVLFNTIASLSLAGFFMYSVQELALSRLEGRIVHMMFLVKDIIVLIFRDIQSSKLPTTYTVILHHHPGKY